MFFPCALVLGRDIDYSISIDVKCHLDLRNTTRGRGNSNLPKCACVCGGVGGRREKIYRWSKCMACVWATFGLTDQLESSEVFVVS